MQFRQLFEDNRNYIHHRSYEAANNEQIHVMDSYKESIPRQLILYRINKTEQKEESQVQQKNQNNKESFI